MHNGLHIVDPSGFSFWKKFFTVVAIVAAVVAVVATAGTLAPAIAPGLASTAFFTSAVGETLLAAAPTIVGASFAVAGASAAAAATIPGHSSSTGNSIPINTGTPFTPTPPSSSPAGDFPTNAPPPTSGDPVPEPPPTVLRDPLPGRLPIGPIIDTVFELGQMYNALKASETPKPTNDVGQTPGKSEKPPILQDAEKVGPNTWRRGKGRHREYIRKDTLHPGEYEVYDRLGRHKGAFDENGRMIKPPKPGRRI